VTHDITEYDENKHIEEDSGDSMTPPLCLVHYFAERTAYPPERNPKPPGKRVGRVVERRGNLIILEFAPPPMPGKRQGKGRMSRVYDMLVILLLLACLLGCLAVFRF